MKAQVTFYRHTWFIIKANRDRVLYDSLKMFLQIDNKKNIFNSFIICMREKHFVISINVYERVCHTKTSYFTSSQWLCKSFSRPSNGSVRQMNALFLKFQLQSKFSAENCICLVVSSIVFNAEDLESRVVLDRYARFMLKGRIFLQTLNLHNSDEFQDGKTEFLNVWK